MTDKRRKTPIFLARGQVAALVMVLSACAVGPDFETPVPPDVERFTPEKTASPGNGQRFAEGASVPARWWTAFGSTQLDALIQEALDRNPTLEAADAAIRVAQYNADAATGAFFPQVVLNSNSSYQINSGDATSLTVTQSAYSFFTKQVQISYAPDIWGANRRTVEGLEAQRDMQGQDPAASAA